MLRSTHWKPHDEVYSDPYISIPNWERGLVRFSMSYISQNPIKNFIKFIKSDFKSYKVFLIVTKLEPIFLKLDKHFVFLNIILIFIIHTFIV